MLPRLTGDAATFDRWCLAIGLLTDGYRVKPSHPLSVPSIHREVSSMMEYEAPIDLAMRPSIYLAQTELLLIDHVDT